MPRRLAAVLAAAFAYNMASAMSVNSLVLRLIEVGRSPVEVSYVNFALNALFIAMSAWAGRLGDKLGSRKPLVGLGLVVLASSAALAALVFDASPLTVAVVSASLAGAAGALVSANVTMLALEAGAPAARRPERVLARLGFASGGGWAAGLALGSAVSAAYGTSVNFHVAVAVATLGLATLAAGVKGPMIPLERLHAIKPPSPFYGFVDRVKMVYALIVEPPKLGAKVRRGLEDPLLLTLVAVLVAFSGIGVFFTQVPVFLRRVLGMGDAEVFAALSVHSLTSTASFTFIHRLVERLTPARALTLALLVRAVAFAAPPVVALTAPQAVPAIFLATGFTWSMISVSMNSIVVAISEEERKGERLGQLTSMTSLGLLVGSAASGLLVEALGFHTAFVSAAALEAVAAAIIYLAVGAGRTRAP